MTDYKYIRIEEAGIEHKRQLYMVRNLKSNGIIGRISFYPRWRGFVFEPMAATVFTPGCLDDISSFIRAIPKPPKRP